MGQQMKVVHSCRFWQILEDRIRRQQNRVLLARINAAYADEPDAEEQTLRCKLKRQHRKTMEGDLSMEPREPE
jgi:siderophore synthetase component